jgi:Septin
VVVRAGLAEAGLDFGVFEPTKKSADAMPKRQGQLSPPNGSDHADVNGEAFSEDEEVAYERQARGVIKLRPPRHRNPSRSRSRRDLSQVAEDVHRPASPDAADRESVANVRFSAHIVAKADLRMLLPFALIAPEGSKRRQRPVSPDSRLLNTSPTSGDQPSEDGHAPSIDTIPRTPASVHSARVPYLQGPPDDLKGVFIRKFRWGTVDVLDPNHCDFAALRTAVLSTHIKVCSFVSLFGDNV